MFCLKQPLHSCDNAASIWYDVAFATCLQRDGHRALPDPGKSRVSPNTLTHFVDGDVETNIMSVPGVGETAAARLAKVCCMRSESSDVAAQPVVALSFSLTYVASRKESVAHISS